MSLGPYMFFVVALLGSGAGALQPLMTRRGVFQLGTAGISSVLVDRANAAVGAPAPKAGAAFDTSTLDSTGVGTDRNFLDDMDNQPQQMAATGKLDVNAAAVTDYKTIKGLYPKVAGKIASHGPYEKVSDVYQYLDKREAALFRANEKTFVALPPGRLFIERINQRQSL